jgi:hypothetical protein
VLSGGKGHHVASDASGSAFGGGLLSVRTWECAVSYCAMNLRGALPHAASANWFGNSGTCRFRVLPDCNGDAYSAPRGAMFVVGLLLGYRTLNPRQLIHHPFEMRMGRGMPVQQAHQIGHASESILKPPNGPGGSMWRHGPCLLGILSWGIADSNPTNSSPRDNRYFYRKYSAWGAALVMRGGANNEG